MKKVFIYFLAIVITQSSFGQTDSNNVEIKKIEVMPQYPGGDEARDKFLSDNLTYPPLAKKQGIQGKVWVGFIVSKDGSISDVEILRGIGGGCDEEVKRVIEKMPNWIPGTIGGEPVIVKFRFPINFTLYDNGQPTKKKNKK